MIFKLWNQAGCFSDSAENRTVSSIANWKTNLRDLVADCGQNIFDGHAGWRGCEDASSYNSVRRRQPPPTELTDSGNNRRTSTAWRTVNHQRTSTFNAVHERRLQLLNSIVTVRVVKWEIRRIIPVRINAALLWSKHFNSSDSLYVLYN